MKYSATIDVPDLDAGTAFYMAVFGLEQRARPIPAYAVLADGEVRLGIMQKPEGSAPAPAPDTRDRRHYARHWTPVHLDFEVEDYDATLARLLAAGGAVERSYDIEGRPRTAFCADPFGNGFCLMEARD